MGPVLAVLANCAAIGQSERVSSHHLAAHATPRVTRRTRVLLTLALLPFLLATAVGIVALRPEHRTHPTPANLGAPAQLVDGTVHEITTSACAGDPSTNQCTTVHATATSGPDSGRQVTFLLQVGPGQPQLHVDDPIVMGRSVDTGGTATYYFSDFQRKAPLMWLGLAFAVLIVLVGRWRGIGAILGLGFTWFAMTQFLLPAILDGKSPVLVALTVGACIVVVVQYLAHGPRARTTVAILGTLTGLAITAALAYFSLDAAHISGLSSDEVTYVQTYAGAVDVHGLLLAGIVFGSLGVLNDVTVTQASAAWEIHAARPTLSRWSIYRAGMRVGRDHIASTVYTLVLAYAGAALPLLILFTLSGRSGVEVFSSEVVGEEVVRAVVGSIGLVAVVPVTTALAAITTKAQPVRPVAADDPVATEDDLDQLLEHAPQLDLRDEIVIDTDDRANKPEPELEPEQAEVETGPTIPKSLGRARKGTRHLGETRKMSRKERRFWSNTDPS
jgi:uncharacterized membrane protein